MNKQISKQIDRIAEIVPKLWSLLTTEETELLEMDTGLLGLVDIAINLLHIDKETIDVINNNEKLAYSFIANLE